MEGGSAKIVTYADLREVGERARARGLLVVLTTGVFDNLHSGHVNHIDNCVRLFTPREIFLVVGVCNDRILKALKGPERPFIPQDDRAKMLSDIDVVNAVVISEETDDFCLVYDRLVDQLRPKYWVTPNHPSFYIMRETVCKRYGAQIVACHRDPPPESPEISTTLLLSMNKAA